MATKKSALPKERLMSVRPSGKKDESVTELIADLVKQIPRGRVSTYGAIAAVLNLSNPRMVGRAMRDVGRSVPAQRVVTSSGRLSHDGGARKKLLLQEGVEFKGDKILNFKALFWDPAVEL